MSCTNRIKVKGPSTYRHSQEDYQRLNNIVLKLIKNISSEIFQEDADPGIMLSTDDKQTLFRAFMLSREGVEASFAKEIPTYKILNKALEKCDLLVKYILFQYVANVSEESKKLKVLANNFHSAFVTSKVHKHLGIIGKNSVSTIEKHEIEGLHRFIDAAYCVLNDDEKLTKSDFLAVHQLERALEQGVRELEKSGDTKKLTLETLLVDYYHNLDKQTPSIAGKELDAFVHIICRVSEDLYLPDNLQTALRSFSNYLGEVHQEKMKSAGASTSPRDTSRVPEAVFVDFIYSLGLELKKYKKMAILESLKQGAEESYFMGRRDLSSVRKLLNAALKSLNSFPELNQLGSKCSKLLDQLPELESDLLPTQFHDCLYGRVFDSAVVERLVRKTPDSVCKAMTAVSRHVADWLSKQDPRLQEKVTDQLMWFINRNDPRFWFPKTPLIQKMQQVSSWKEAFPILIEYLNKEKATGYEVISGPYLIVKICLALDHNKEVVFEPILPERLNPLPEWSKAELDQWDNRNREIKSRNDEILWKPIPWMRSANSNYSSVIYRQRSVESPSPGNISKMKASGITLLHQPPVAPHSWMIPSERPSNKNRPNLQKPSQSLKVALVHGLPWGVGVSNSTSIMLHVLNHAIKSGKDIDITSLLLGTMMFLVYDGGHSVQEVLWTANQLNKMLKLDLDLSDSENPNSFIADYQRFSDIFPKELSSQVKKVFSKAMDDVITYFGKYSYSVLS